MIKNKATLFHAVAQQEIGKDQQTILKKEWKQHVTELVDWNGSQKSFTIGHIRCIPSKESDAIYIELFKTPYGNQSLKE